MLRVFVGIPASEKIKQLATEWAKKYASLPLRFVSGNGLHITLVPPWYAENADCAVGEINDLATAVKPFKIRFKEITLGTSPKRPRLIWTMAEDFEKEEILKLKKTSEAVFGQRPVGTVAYNPHLTLARFNENDFESLGFKELREKIDWEMEVNSVALYESKLLHEGAQYEILKEIKLNG